MVSMVTMGCGRMNVMYLIIVLVEVLGDHRFVTGQGFLLSSTRG